MKYLLLLLAVVSLQASADDSMLTTQTSNVYLPIVSEALSLAEMVGPPEPPPKPPVDRSWHVLAVAESGTVTILKGLTKHEADFAAARLQGLPATPAEVKQDADEKAKADLAEKVERQREDDDLVKRSRLCPKDGEPNYADPVWQKFLESDTSVKMSDHSWENACHEKNGTLYTFGGGITGFDESSIGRPPPPDHPWTRHAAMKLVEVFQ